ncbi:MAG: hypothetical protein ACI9OD_004680 [Limisphaerales bacterium]|jgi:hypothetical protein
MHRTFYIIFCFAIAVANLPTGQAAGRLGDQDYILKKAAEHWAFQPLRKPKQPAVKDAAWIRNGIDAFVLNKLESKQLSPAPPADSATLTRRIYFDLTGLPPSYGEIRQWSTEPNPSKLTETLLKSHHYGERWGRHWLDVARYADTKGHMPSTQEKRFPFAYTYRDWVIKALNDDVPYDQFLKFQIAADHMVANGRATTNDLAALGFLTVGSRFSGKSDLVLDDRIDVVTRGTMGLTVSCARCHDHMFDPIPTADYYSLYGVFLNSSEPTELPEIARTQSDPAAEKAFRKQHAKLQGEVDQFLKSHHDRLRKAEWIAKYMKFSIESAGLTRSKALSEAGKLDLFTRVGLRWNAGLKAAERLKLPAFKPWHLSARLFHTGKTAEAQAALRKWLAGPKDQLNAHVAAAMTKSLPASLDDLTQMYGSLLEEADADTPHEDKDREALRQMLHHPAGPTGFPVADMRRYLNRAAGEKHRKLKSKVDKFVVDSPGTPPRAMVVADAGKMRDSYIFLRGKASSRGPKAPRQFLSILEGPNRKPFTEGSGRLELASKIAAPDNPLTARVIVNRVWMHHFGNALVATPSDFGLQAPRPVHHQLLDWLAAYLIENKWSLKKLHHLIVNSATYRQSSEISEQAWKLDPANELWSRAEQRRRDFESTRDALLTVSGELNRSLGGRPAKLDGNKATLRRAVYGFIDRYSVAASLRTFDFADPNLHAPRRPETTVPQQALFFLNSPFVQARAQRLVTRISPKSHTQMIQEIYRKSFGRDCTSDELAAAQSFVGSVDHENLVHLAQALLASNEFSFID